MIRSDRDGADDSQREVTKNPIFRLNSMTIAFRYRFSSESIQFPDTSHLDKYEGSLFGTHVYLALDSPNSRVK